MSDPTRRPLSDLIADLDISEAEYAAGDLVAGETVLEELRASIARLEANRQDAPPRGAATRQ
ncbi:hypothetical protein [Nitrospirillum sp. BR 11828]|uniref:hypothetical protein n=1 Tax=Nitrospirillum sp. BR 11828 TaxID=3104325 RepID=UPI002ACA3F74|nr:hypothetical protein [Nitrospirillum sp. BR 11828]MDZ5646417.1 hypothetical protein [Nitrospirillum sp. BR 11828]